MLKEYWANTIIFIVICSPWIPLRFVEEWKIQLFWFLEFLVLHLFYPDKTNEFAAEVRLSFDASVSAAFMRLIRITFLKELVNYSIKPSRSHGSCTYTYTYIHWLQTWSATIEFLTTCRMFRSLVISIFSQSFKKRYETTNMSWWISDPSCFTDFFCIFVFDSDIRIKLLLILGWNWTFGSSKVSSRKHFDINRWKKLYSRK